MNSTTLSRFLLENKTIIAKAMICSFIIILNACTTDADESFDAASVCPSEGTNIYGMPNRGTFIDERDDQEYRYITVGEQVWMNDNLNFSMDKSVCYDGVSENCDKYGRLYALQYGALYFNVWDSTYGFLNFDVVENTCPEGWRIPVLSEWEELIKKSGGLENMKNDVCMNVSFYAQSGIAYHNGLEFGYYPDGRDWWTQTYSPNFTLNGHPMLYYIDFGIANIYLKDTEQGYKYIRCIKETL